MAHHRFYLGSLAVTLTLACGAGDPNDSGSDSEVGGSATVGGASSGGTTSGATSGTASGGTATGGVQNTGGAATGGVQSSGGNGSGGTMNGGTAGTGGSQGGTGGGPHNVLPCDELSAIGEWEDLTPPGVEMTQDFALDPVNAGTIYLGTSGDGIWKSTDCGSTWVNTNTGQNGDKVQNAGHWTVAVDHQNPEVLYTGNGYGESGVWKSTNSGVDWAQVVPENIAKTFIQGGFVERITVDPTNSQHLLVSPHFSCENGYTHCMWETTDAGATWSVLDNTPPVTEDSGQIMIDSQHWYYANPWGDGLYRTTNAGGSWANVAGYGSTDSFYIADDGTYYTSNLSVGVIKSTDQGASWDVIPNSPHHRAMIGDGTHLYASNRSSGPYPYESTLEADPTTWSTYESPSLPNGGWVLHYDRDHGVLYSSTENNGFWRVKTK